MQLHFYFFFFFFSFPYFCSILLVSAVFKIVSANTLNQAKCFLGKRKLEVPFRAARELVQPLAAFTNVFSLLLPLLFLFIGSETPLFRGYAHYQPNIVLFSPLLGLFFGGFSWWFGVPREHQRRWVGEDGKRAVGQRGMVTCLTAASC